MIRDELIAEELLNLYEFNQMVRNSGKVYIYGAGMVGSFIYDYLRRHALADKVKCFFTSEQQEGSVCGVPKCLISKEGISETDLVVIAGKRAIRKEMTSTCQNIGINNYFEIDVFDDRTYEYYASIPEKAYEIELRRWYFEVTGKELNLIEPKTYNEKINWMKIYEQNPLKTRLTDKYAVREWVKERIGEEYLVPILGKWEKASEIDFDKLPDSFVLKCNHGCGYNVIVKDKTRIDQNEVRERIAQYLSRNYAFEYGFEMHYKGIKPCVLAEEYMENSGGDLFDYKFWCFDGKVRFVMFLSERQKKLRMNNYDLNWNYLPFTYNYENTDHEVPKPEKLEKMIRIAEILSQGFNHVRVDLYQLNDGTIRFGEMTFSSCSGVCIWNPASMDEKIGEWLNISC